MSNEVEVISDSEVVEGEIVDYGLADASTIETAAWPLDEALHRISTFASKYPGYQDELIRALGNIEIAKGIMKSLQYKTYGDYGHTA